MISTSYYASIFDSLELGIIIVDDSLLIKYANQWVYRKSGKTLNEVINTPIGECFPEIKDFKIFNACQKIIAKKISEFISDDSNNGSFNFYNYTNNKKIPIKQKISILTHQSDDQYILYEIRIEDISDKCNSHNKMAIAENRLQSLTKIVPAGVFYTDLAGKLIFSSEMCSFITGQTNNNCYWYSTIIESERDLIVRRWIEDRNRFSYCSYECKFSRDGDIVWGLAQITEEKDSCGNLIGYLGTITDITTQKEYHSNIEQLAYYDSLTGLANRRLFCDRLERELRSSARMCHNIALLHIDIDNFKRINDSVGQSTGDSIISALAKRISATVAEENTVARIGGDEFAVLLTNLENTNLVAQTANHIVKAISAPIKIEDKDIVITTSIGVAIAPLDASEYEDIMKCAELAMYNVKEKGRNNFQFFSPYMNNSASERLALESDLRNALHKEQFYLCYQPKFYIDTCEIFGVEALVRWKHPERGEIRPDEFIYIAEQMGQIVALGKYVMKKACQDLKNLQGKSIVKPDFSVSVNLSVKQFQSLNLLNTVVKNLFDAGLPGHCLDLEITESIIMENLEQAIEMLTCMKNYGVSISIDDFGTGYSSLGYLKQLPVDTVKIDRSFVRDIPDDTGNTSIVNAIIAMSHKLDLKVVAEGIETDQQLETLKEMHCDYGQGYLISKPLILEELEQLILKQNSAFMQNNNLLTKTSENRPQNN